MTVDNPNQPKTIQNRPVPADRYHSRIAIHGGVRCSYPAGASVKEATMGKFAVEYRNDDGTTVRITGFATFEAAAAWVREHTSGWWALVRYDEDGPATVPAAA